MRLVDGAVVSAEAAPGSTGRAETSRYAPPTDCWIAGPRLGRLPLVLRDHDRGRRRRRRDIDRGARCAWLSGGLVGSLCRGRGERGAITLAAETLRLEAGGPFAYVASVSERKREHRHGKFRAAHGSGISRSRPRRASASTFSIGEPGGDATEHGEPRARPGWRCRGRVAADRARHGARIAAGGLGRRATTAACSSARTTSRCAARRSSGASAATRATGRSGGVRIDGTGRLTLGSLAERGASLATADERRHHLHDGRRAVGDRRHHHQHGGGARRLRVEITITASGLGGSGSSQDQRAAHEADRGQHQHRHVSTTTPGRRPSQPRRRDHPQHRRIARDVAACCHPPAGCPRRRRVDHQPDDRERSGRRHRPRRPLHPARRGRRPGRGRRQRPRAAT